MSEVVKINNLTISNFKSIKSVTLSDCRRINVLIGRPNVGKSNILESLAVFDVPYMVNATNRSLKKLIRVENLSDLFHNGNTSSPVEITTDHDHLTISRAPNNGLLVEISSFGTTNTFTFSQGLMLATKKVPDVYPYILGYYFTKHIEPEPSNFDFLQPPYGANLMDTVSHIQALKSDLSQLFHSYGLKMLFDAGSRQIKAMKEDGMDMYLVPFNSLADSLQRLIFYKSAIESNHNKVICFEEPEAHTFPPYIANIVDDIVLNYDNQYFITTHSPYVISSLLESAGNDLAIYLTEMKENQTIVHRLDDSQLQDIYDCGMDVFFNIEAFLDK